MSGRPSPAPAEPLAVLLVHGMGRSPLSWTPLRLHLRSAGHRTVTFGYCAALEDVPRIQSRLLQKLEHMSSLGAFVVVGHSLGGVLLRAALAEWPAHLRPPRHVFLLGSPVRPASLAVRLQRRWVYRALTGDAGQLLASAPRMAALGPPPVPTTAILGTGGWSGSNGPFPDEPNDGLVAASEARATWISEERRVHVLHSFLPSSAQVAEVLVDCLRGLARA